MGKIFITQARTVGDFCVELKFNDQTTQIVNIGEFIRKNPHPQYNKYLDEKEFEKFVIDNGNVVWGKDWDLIFPIEELHKGKIL